MNCGPRTCRVAWSVLEVADLFETGEPSVRKMLDAGALAYVPLSPGRVVILEGDTSRAADWDGRQALARAFRDADTGKPLQNVHVDEVAAALGCSRRTLERCSRAGTLPTIHNGKFQRDDLVRALLRLRVPPSWEVAA